jgi:hypothetical protein
MSSAPPRPNKPKLKKKEPKKSLWRVNQHGFARGAPKRKKTLFGPPHAVPDKSWCCQRQPSLLFFAFSVEQKLKVRVRGVGDSPTCPQIIFLT